MKRQPNECLVPFLTKYERFDVPEASKLPGSIPDSVLVDAINKRHQIVRVTLGFDTPKPGHVEWKTEPPLVPEPSLATELTDRQKE